MSLISQTFFTPPICIVPEMATAMRPASITIAWNTSVHTTAFRPPCYRQKQRIKYKTDNPPRGYDCFLMSEPRLHAPFDVRASFTWYHSTTLHYQRAVLMQSITEFCYPEFFLNFNRLRPIRLLPGLSRRLAPVIKSRKFRFFNVTLLGIYR